MWKGGESSGAPPARLAFATMRRDFGACFVARPAQLSGWPAAIPIRMDPSEIDEFEALGYGGHDE